MKQEVISLTRQQLNKLDIINKANAGFISVPDAASALGLSERQIQRLKKKVRNAGAAALVHQNSLKVPHNAISAETIKKIIELKRSELYQVTNFRHFVELLSEHHEIEISYTA